MKMMIDMIDVVGIKTWQLVQWLSQNYNDDDIDDDDHDNFYRW